MSAEIENDIWIVQTLRLAQALLGAVSPNFRMVAIANQDQTWRLIFVLAVDSAEDREEIDDVASEFEALQESSICYRVEILVTDEPITWPAPSIRVVYRRREP
ncbi:hypothetical protein [Massilia sp. TS11]|uniref:hypothetical protein n=1 Tax=Massilia sp. TS11 TaxID=2908003 RepID=UPI001EDB18D7|nr:hypothetical protein [Massilia sp. TS11]MCG2583852.1 hypothetical protein [Massilia sp. TS11]